MTTPTKPSSQIGVLSYNICFQAMTSHASGSAPYLGQVCTPIKPHSKLTICGDNMANMIEDIPAAIGLSSLDFVGLQEASRYYELTAHAPNTLGKMACVHSKEGISHMASYYDSTKYTLMKKYFGDFTHDRPFQVLVFKHSFDASGTIFINSHNPHGYTYPANQKHLVNAIKGNLTVDEKAYRIIAVGDYNETDWDWKTGRMDKASWAPFDTEITTEISVTNTGLITCAKDGKWANADYNDNSISWRGGDYVFDSKSIAPIQVPPNYTYDKYLSDHLPVVALLPG